MGGDVETIKERLDIAEVVGSYIKLEKAGQSYKARCPFHNEKTPSFYVSPARGSYYCFGCGAKGDIFTFVEQTEGIDFREALKVLADRAGVELKKFSRESQEEKTEKDKILEALEEATQFFENELASNDAAREYLKSRGITEESMKEWRLGYAPAEWRSLYGALLSKGYPEAILIKAGLIKKVEAGSGKNPYDVFRDRVMFPLKDTAGRVIAFSGRALSKETEPKYLNSPDTLVFTKHEVLYGLDKAKEKIRRKNYAILVEGQMDLVLSHQVGIDNTVASSGTAFTQAHLERLKKLSKRILLAFDGDRAGQMAAEKSTELALLLGLEVKIAALPEGKDPAELAQKDPQSWKEVLRQAKPAIEHFLDTLAKNESDGRKLGKWVEKKILPLIALLESAMERSHFVSLVAKRTGIKDEIVWEDLRRVKKPTLAKVGTQEEAKELEPSSSNVLVSRRERLEERLTEVRLWQKEMKGDSQEIESLKKEEAEIETHLEQEVLKEELSRLTVALAQAETSKDESNIEEVMRRVNELHKAVRKLEEKKSSVT